MWVQITLHMPKTDVKRSMLVLQVNTIICYQGSIIGTVANGVWASCNVYSAMAGQVQSVRCKWGDKLNFDHLCQASSYTTACNIAAAAGLRELGRCKRENGNVERDSYRCAWEAWDAAGGFLSKLLVPRATRPSMKRRATKVAHAWKLHQNVEGPADHQKQQRLGRAGHAPMHQDGGLDFMFLGSVV